MIKKLIIKIIDKFHRSNHDQMQIEKFITLHELSEFNRYQQKRDAAYS